MRELGPAFEEGSSLPRDSTVCSGQSLALLGSDGWVALAGGTGDSWMKSQLVADASQEELHLCNAMCHQVSKGGSLS